MKADFSGSENCQTHFINDLESIRFALNAAGIGVWEVQISNNQVIWDDRCRELFGLAKNNVLPYEEAIRYIHPDDVDMVNQKVLAALKGENEGLYDATYRTIGADDHVLRWVNFSGKAYFDNQGELCRFGGVAQDVSDKVAHAEALRQKESGQLQVQIDQMQQMMDAFELSPVAIAILDRDELTIRMANQFYCSIVGRSKESILGRPMLEALPELAGQGFDRLMKVVIESGKGITANGMPAQLLRDGQMETIYVNLSYEPVYQSDGTVSGVLVVAVDVTGQVKARQEAELAITRLNLLSNTVPAMIFYLDGEQRYQSYNQQFRDWFGVDENEALGKTVREFVGEAAYKTVARYLAKAYTGEVVNYELPAPARLKGVRWLNITYTPHKDSSGEVLGIIVLATDITKAKEGAADLERSERRFRSLIESAPAAMCLFTGKGQNVIEVANEPMLKIWGKDQSVIGKPWLEAIPELVGQPFDDILNNIYDTGQPFTGTGMPAQLEVEGVLGTYYFDFTYQPIFDEAKQVIGILDIAVDVTERTLARKALEESEASLTAAIDLAELGTWKIDLETNRATYSPRLQEWLGVGESDVNLAASPMVHPDDRERIGRALLAAIENSGDGQFDETYRIVHLETGRVRIIHASGRAQFGAEGKAVSITGTAQDITIQKELQFALEQEVMLRTQELAVSNNQLKTSVDDLGHSNNALLRSNEELSQYAYVASHDLQEPLRKIQLFSSMLVNNHEMPASMLPVLGKIDASAKRMTVLIRDLLNFSRLLKADSLFEPVDLSRVVALVRQDYDVMIAEKKAVVLIDELPVIEAVPFQMQQLFFNLIGNALKFSSPQVSPVVRINCSEETNLKNINVKPDGGRLFRISVSDNGIGFRPEYAQQIFEVFKRLHGKEVYAGTGIGLALCKRIVENHQGIIAAEGEPGKGATFHFLLPEKQG